MKQPLPKRTGVLWILLAVALGGVQCAPSRFVKPLEKGEQAINVHVGGALVKVPDVATIPLPLTSLTYGRGLTNNTTVFGSWHTTSALFGVYQFEIGGVHRLYGGGLKKIGITATPALNFAYDKFEKNAKLWPMLDVNAYWDYRKAFVPASAVTVEGNAARAQRKFNQFFYAGVGNWFELSSTGAHGREQPTNWLLSPQVGHSWRSEKRSFQLELKWLAPGRSNENIVVDYASPGNKGALGFYFSYSWFLQKET